MTDTEGLSYTYSYQSSESEHCFQTLKETLEKEIIKYFKRKCSKLENEVIYLKKKCSNIENERNYYIHQGPVLELFSKYVGLYNVEEKSLILHHFVDNKSIFPYGEGAYEGNYKCVTVRGSWDNWAKDHVLNKKCVRDSDGIYEGYVYYIIHNNIIPGNVYDFKFKDLDGEWIEPVYEGESADDTGCQVKLKQNSSGSWNALLRAKTII